VLRDSVGHYWASFVVTVQVPDEPVVRTGRSTGLDLGLAIFATTEDPATDVGNPRFLRQNSRVIVKGQRRMERRSKGSARYERARIDVAKTHQKVANQRRDFHHNAARGLVSAYDRVGVEDKIAKNLLRRPRVKPDPRRQGRFLPNGAAALAGRHRSIADAGWAAFVEILSWQLRKAGGELVRLSAYATTQRCSRCGAKAKPRMELSDRVFNCYACGLVIGRDRNAARNLHPAQPVNRLGCSGVGVEGSKTDFPEGTSAA
jgi:putative transposase